MRIEDINRDREKFLQHIQNSLEPELKKIGLVLINVNITDITDEIGLHRGDRPEGGVAGDPAGPGRRGRAGEAWARSASPRPSATRSIQVANATKLREIGTREASREQAVRVAELDKEQKVGEQTAAFRARGPGQRRPSRQMRIAMAEANAKAVAGENTAAGRSRRLAGRRCRSRRPRRTSSAKTRKREAEAAVHRSPEPGDGQGRAGRGRARRGRAAGPSSKRRPRPRRPGSSSKPRPRPRNAASKPRARRPRSSPSSKPRPAASTRSWPRRAKACKQIIEACGGAQQAFQLLMLEHLDKLAETSAKAISNIKFDKVVVWENGGQNGNEQHGRLPAQHGRHACRR